jgi:glutathione synthase
MIQLGVLMDPLSTVNVKKDSTLAMVEEAQARGWQVHYFEQQDLFVRDGRALINARPLTLALDSDPFYKLGPARVLEASALNVILMRKDPPFDMEYVYCTYLLELARATGVLVVNDPTALRGTNEKVAISRFPQCAPPTLISRDAARLREFIADQGEVVLKPLDGMGGRSVFRVDQRSPNVNVIIETLTERGHRFAMAQRFVPDIGTTGDKRIILVDGIPAPGALARIPAPGESRGNLAAGAAGRAAPLTERDRWLCDQIGPSLKQSGILFAGLDVIGDYVTEVNVTSPTGIREIDRFFGLRVAALLLDSIEERLSLTARSAEPSPLT